MSNVRYCECGRRIVVRVHNKKRVGFLSDNEHDLCERCWSAVWEQAKQRLEVHCG